MYSSRLYAQNTVFEIVHDEGSITSLFYTCGCEKQYRTDECICAARVTQCTTVHSMYVFCEHHA